MILRNLIANALEAIGTSSDTVGPKNHRVTVRAEPAPTRPQTHVRIDVDDTGPGIAPASVDMLFEPLRSSKPNGMGLGLALSRSIAERMGGRLWYDSHPRVTRFCLEVPITALGGEPITRRTRRPDAEPPRTSAQPGSPSK
jgi:signal transduction histidine kinase